MIKIEDIELWHGDCLGLMKDIPDKSVDMILCDLPYGTTQCKWDTIIPFELLWSQYNRIIKDNGAIVLFGSQPFTSELIHSNIKNYKYNWTWVKSKSSNFLNAKKQPLRTVEDICVFYKKQCTYNPQMIILDKPKVIKRTQKTIQTTGYFNSINHSVYTEAYPKNVLYYNNEMYLHPTQKPVPLCEYLIKTYTNEGETVLDNCMGSGTTGVACKNLNRRFIGIEIDDTYFEIAKERINKAVENTKSNL